jgi:malate/lactate dehydrogenase
MRKKVTVVGGGFVGSTTAQRIHDAGLADVVLTDILEGVPAGKALDMAESAPTRTQSAFPLRPAITKKPRTATSL